jgi:GDPmannose 4,6-dehydratase
MDQKVALITGISGQDGNYLAALLLQKNYKVVGITRSSPDSILPQLAYLGVRPQEIIWEQADLLDYTQVANLIATYRPTEIYNLAAQSSVSVSFKQPISTLNFNIMSVLNLLEAIRIGGLPTRFYQATSSEMYGTVPTLPINEKMPLNPISPYAISKSTAHYMVRNYREAYGLFACSGVLFNHESYLRRDGFFVNKIIKEAYLIQEGKQDKLLVGNLNVKRDFGFAPRYVEAMWLMLQQDVPDDYMVCSGTSIYLHEIVHYVFDRLGLDTSLIEISPALYRPTDIPDIYGDNTLAKQKLGWDYDMTFFEVLDIILAEEEQARQKLK